LIALAQEERRRPFFRDPGIVRLLLPDTCERSRERALFFDQSWHGRKPASRVAAMARAPSATQSHLKNPPLPTALPGFSAVDPARAPVSEAVRYAGERGGEKDLAETEGDSPL
jgi:hypothetical protein